MNLGTLVTSPFIGWVTVIALRVVVGGSACAEEQPWTKAAEQKPPMTVAETKSFMKRHADYVVEHHLKKDERSPQRGMIYKYFGSRSEGLRSNGFRARR